MKTARELNECYSGLCSRVQRICISFLLLVETFPFLNIVLACVMKLEHSESPESFLLTYTNSRECSTGFYFPRTGKCRDTLIVIDCKNSWNRWVMGQLSLYSLFNKNNAFSYCPTCTKFKRWKVVLEMCFVCMSIYSWFIFQVHFITF